MLGGALLLDILGLAYSARVPVCVVTTTTYYYNHRRRLAATTTTITATTTSTTFVLMQRTSVDVMRMRRKDPEELPAARSFD